MNVWCEVCEIGWPAPDGDRCPDCGGPSTAANLIYPCLASTGLDAEGRAYIKRHPELRGAT